MTGERGPNLLLNSSLGGMENGPIGGWYFHLGDTGHGGHTFESLDRLIGFMAAFIPEDVGHRLGMCIGGLGLQDSMVEEVTTEFSSHRLRLLISE